MPRIVDHDQQREILLDACFRLFAEEGYVAASMRKLAKAANVSTGTLYHYFPDKEAILSGMFALLTQRDTARVANQLPADASPELRIRAVFAFYREHRDYLGHLLRIVLEVHRHEPSDASRDRVREAVRNYRAALSDLLGIDEQLGAMAFSFLLGTLIQGDLDPDALDLDVVEAFMLAASERLLG